MKSRGYPLPGADLAQIATLVHADLSREGYDVRILPAVGPGPVVEVRRPNGLLQRSTGYGAVLTVRLVPTPMGFEVHVGTGRLGDAAAGAVEWLLATPALVTEGYAAFQQAQVDERVLRVVDHWVANVARVPRAPAPVPTVGPCATCKTPMPYGARFCPRCGNDTQAPVAAACPGCRGAVALDARFCPHCGKALAANTCSGCGASLEGAAAFCSGCGRRQ